MDRSEYLANFERPILVRKNAGAAGGLWPENPAGMIKNRDTMRKIRFGVVGTNFVTDWVIAGARQDPRFELAAVCSRTRERAAEFAARHGIARTFVSLEEMAASDAIDAVYIATPNCMHAAQAVCCMERGKHVLCEKPMASNAREVRAMIEASRRNGVALMEAVKTTLTPNFMALREALPKAGTIRR